MFFLFLFFLNNIKNTIIAITAIIIILAKLNVQILEYNNIVFENPIEKMHIVIGIIENLCHEVVYHKHNKINYEVMENETINLIMKLLK